MQYLNSENYESVGVVIRSLESQLTLKPDKGAALMAYLTSGKDISPFVELTDQDGRTLVVKVTEIVRVEPKYLPKKVDLTKLEVPA